MRKKITLTKADKYYLSNDKPPICAGCDFWNTDAQGYVGECTKNAPVSAEQRHGLVLKISSKQPAEAGHLLTYRDHGCGDFKDSFDWDNHRW